MTGVQTCALPIYAKRLKELETENGWRKRLLADALLENEVRKEALRKK